METRGWMTIEDGGDALLRLAEELDAKHAPPFTLCFLDEHWRAVERVLERMANGPETCQILKLQRR